MESKRSGIIRETKMEKNTNTETVGIPAEDVTKTAPCIACGKQLNLPGEYLDACGKVRKEVDNFRPAIRLDLLVHEVKDPLSELIKKWKYRQSCNNQEFQNDISKAKAHVYGVCAEELLGVLGNMIKTE
jgi:predicted amidophosphoribosyltransferase